MTHEIKMTYETLIAAIDHVLGEGPAEQGYITRPEIETAVQRYFGFHHTLLLVYGASGVGKTSLIRRLVKKEFKYCIELRCTKDMQFRQLISELYDLAIRSVGTRSERL